MMCHLVGLNMTVQQRPPACHHLLLLLRTACLRHPPMGTHPLWCPAEQESKATALPTSHRQIPGRNRRGLLGRSLVPVTDCGKSSRKSKCDKMMLKHFVFATNSLTFEDQVKAK